MLLKKTAKSKDKIEINALDNGEQKPESTKQSDSDKKGEAKDTGEVKEDKIEKEEN